jgi:hypothetical protein
LHSLNGFIQGKKLNGETSGLIFQGTSYISDNIIYVCYQVTERVRNMKESGMLIRKVFELLRGYPDGLTFKEILEQINKSLFYANVNVMAHDEGALRRACVAPLHAGWLIFRNRNNLSISESGGKAYARYQDPSEFMLEAGKHSVRGWLSIHFTQSYFFAGKIKDQLSVEFRAAWRIGLKRLVGEAFKAPADWEQVLPLQKPRRVAVMGFASPSVHEHIDSEGLAYVEGGHAIYLPPESFRKSVFRNLAIDYPMDAGLKIVKNPGGINESRYVSKPDKGDSRIHLGLIHNHKHLTLVANMLFCKGVGARLYDLIELQCGDQLFTAFLIQHVCGAAPSMPECEAGIKKLRDLEQQELIRVITPLGFKDEEFECPACGGNALMNENSEFRYVDIQNFILVKYESYLRSVAAEATKASHFGDKSFLRGGRYLYQTVPGVDLPAKRSVDERMKVLETLMDSAGVSVEERVVLDVGCNIGMMMAQYLRLGARWCHGWDRSHITLHTERLMFALGCSRFSTSGGDITRSRSMEGDIPLFLKQHLNGCVISYLAVRGHLGWLDALSRIPWKFLIYEGHEGETQKDFEQHIKQLKALVNFRIGVVTKCGDGDSDWRILSILLRT